MTQLLLRKQRLYKNMLLIGAKAFMESSKGGNFSEL